METMLCSLETDYLVILHVFYNSYKLQNPFPSKFDQKYTNLQWIPGFLQIHLK